MLTLYYGSSKNGVYTHIGNRQSHRANVVHLSDDLFDSEMDGNDGGI